ncbi:hypothetical protein [Demequina sp.]|uniref:hypothetical protein n=1 Tax=Demequina sp. TaxID=2050685 RepID=UPI003D1198BC
MAWFEDPEVAQRFLDATRSARRAIAEDPGAWPVLLTRSGARVIRRKGVAGFPYGVIYLVVDGAVFVIAYAHDRREPGYWTQRLDA